MSDGVVGLTGVLSGAVGTGLTGEIMLPIRGGTEAYIAFPVVAGDALAVGALAVVVDFAPPRTVYVAPASGPSADFSTAGCRRVVLLPHPSLVVVRAIGESPCPRLSWCAALPTDRPASSGVKE